MTSTHSGKLSFLISSWNASDAATALVRSSNSRLANVSRRSGFYSLLLKTCHNHLQCQRRMGRFAHDFLPDQLPSENADINETLKILRDAIATDDIVSNYRQSSWP